ITIVVLKLNTRAGLGVLRRDLDYLHKLSARDVECDECVFEWQQLEDVAGAQIAGRDVVFTQATAVHDRERDWFSEFRFCLCSHSVADEIPERACANPFFRKSAFEPSDHFTQLTYFLAVRRDDFFDVR